MCMILRKQRRDRANYISCLRVIKMSKAYKHKNSQNTERKSKEYRNFWNDTKQRAYTAACIITGNAKNAEAAVYNSFKRLFTLDASIELSEEALAGFVLKESKKLARDDYENPTGYDTRSLKERERTLLVLMRIFKFSESTVTELINCDKTYFDGFSGSKAAEMPVALLPIPENAPEEKISALIATLTAGERKFKKRVCIGSAVMAAVFTIAIVALVLSYVFAPPTESERYFISGDFRYYTLDDGSLEIAMYLGEATSVVIPESCDGKAVVSIGADAFADYTPLKKLTIPKTILTVGTNAFESCDSLTTVEYASSEADFSNIIIAKGNDALRNADKVFSPQG